jgi:hypothetical protein
MKPVNNLFVSIVSILGIEAVGSTTDTTSQILQSVDVPSPTEIANIGQVIIQIIIGLVTLYKLCKKKKTV